MLVGSKKSSEKGLHSRSGQSTKLKETLHNSVNCVLEVSPAREKQPLKQATLKLNLNVKKTSKQSISL